MGLNQLVTLINVHAGTEGMATNGLAAALTLYGSRTLTLSQAATQAGVSEEQFIRQLERRGIDVTDAERSSIAGSDRTARAD